MSDQMRRRAGTCGSARTLGLSRSLDVALDLRDEGGLALEGLLLAQAPPELERQPLAVEVAVEVEQERLDPPLVAAVVRVGADRDRGSMPVGGARVDPVGGNEQARLGAEVRGREAERAAARVAGDDRPRELRRPSEQRGS